MTEPPAREAVVTMSSAYVAHAGSHLAVIVRIFSPGSARVSAVTDDRGHLWKRAWQGAGPESSEELWVTQLTVDGGIRIAVTLDQPATAEMSVSQVDPNHL